jgi:simple sugar transport system permease protein
MSFELISRAILAGTPLLLASLGEIYAERSGVLNLGLEGIFVLGAASSFVATIYTGNALIGLFIGGLLGAFVGFLHGLISVSFRGRQVVSGLALTMFSYGLASLIGKREVGKPLSNYIYVGDIWWGIIIVEVILAGVFWYILFKLKAGSMIRSVGNNPSAAQTLGVDVVKVRIISTVFGSFMGGLAGGWYILGYIQVWTEGAGMGRGWIALAIVIVSAWNPLLAPIFSFLFGGIEAALWRFQLPPYNMDPYLLGAIPYTTTLIILFIFMATPIKGYFRPPAALGEPFYKEERTI